MFRNRHPSNTAASTAGDIPPASNATPTTPAGTHPSRPTAAAMGNHRASVSTHPSANRRVFASSAIDVLLCRSAQEWAIDINQPRKFFGSDNWRRLRNAARKVSCVRSSASCALPVQIEPGKDQLAGPADQLLETQRWRPAQSPASHRRQSSDAPIWTRIETIIGLGRTNVFILAPGVLAENRIWRGWRDRWIF